MEIIKSKSENPIYSFDINTENEKTIRITNMSVTDVINLIKCQIKVKCLSINPFTGEVLDFIYLLDRTDNGKILASKSKQQSIKSHLIELTHTECKDEVAKIYGKKILLEGENTPVNCIFEVVVLKKIYDKKRVLFNLFPKIRKDIITGLVSLDIKDGMWIIKVNDNKRKLETLYYWPDIKYLYIVKYDAIYFQEPSEIKNIEQLLC